MYHISYRDKWYTVLPAIVSSWLYKVHNCNMFTTRNNSYCAKRFQEQALAIRQNHQTRYIASNNIQCTDFRPQSQTKNVLTRRGDNIPHCESAYLIWYFDSPNEFLDIVWQLVERLCLCQDQSLFLPCHKSIHMTWQLRLLMSKINTI